MGERPEAVVLEVPRWFHRRRGVREALREEIQKFQALGRNRFVISITDDRHFVSMDVGVLLGIFSLVRTAGGLVAIATDNDKFHALPHPDIQEGLLRFRTVDEARRYVEENEPTPRDHES